MDKPVVFQSEVDKSRWGDGDGGDFRGGGDKASDIVGDGEWLDAHRPGELEGDARSIVAVLRILGLLDDNFGEGDGGEFTGVLGLDDSLGK